MKVTATLRYARISPRKMRAMAAVVRGLPAQDAVSQLTLGSRRAGRPLRMLMESAMANAEHNFSLDKSGLRIAEIRIDGGPVAKRGKPRGFGRIGIIRRRTSHITVVLEGEKKLDEKKVKEKTLARPSEVRAEQAPSERKKRQAPPEDVLQQKTKPSFARRFFRRKAI